MNFIDFVKTEIPEFYNRLKPIYTEWSNGKTDDCLSYYINHKPRFDKMLDIIKRNKIKTDRVAELGSFLPYTAYQLETQFVDCYDILFIAFDIASFTKDKFGFYGINLCKNIPGSYDLKILSEVIEHLPCNLIELQDKITRSMDSGEHLLMTYPMHGFNAKEYDKDFGEHERFRHEHLREFTDITVMQFFTGLVKVDEDEIVYPAYGRIKIILYRKP